MAQGRPGLSVPGPARWSAEARAGLLGRLHRDTARRDALSVRARRALDGVVHALRPDSMDPALPARTLVDYDLDAPEGPVVAIAAGDVTAPTHLTWQVSGMGIAAHTAAWGSAREAAQLAHAQHAAGAPRPCVVAWLGHPAPPWWRTLGDGLARRGGQRLAGDVLDAAGQARRLPGPAVHLALEAHSYGTLVAAHALALLARTDPRTRMDRVVLSGAVGLPAALARRPERLGLAPGTVFEARAPGDVLAVLGRRLAARAGWADVVALPVHAVDGLAGVRGHDTSRHRPEDGDAGRHGYRDPGTVTLAAVARVTAGLPLPSSWG